MQESRNSHIEAPGLNPEKRFQGRWPQVQLTPQNKQPKPRAGQSWVGWLKHIHIFSGKRVPTKPTSKTHTEKKQEMLFLRSKMWLNMKQTILAPANDQRASSPNNPIGLCSPTAAASCLGQWLCQCCQNLLMSDFSMTTFPESLLNWH